MLPSCITTWQMLAFRHPVSLTSTAHAERRHGRFSALHGTLGGPRWLSSLVVVVQCALPQGGTSPSEVAGHAAVVAPASFVGWLP